MKNGSKSERKEEHLMKQYKVTITNGNYPLSYTCDTIADAYACLRTLESWAPARIAFNWDDLMDSLVQMRRKEMLEVEYRGCVITAPEEED